MCSLAFFILSRPFNLTLSLSPSCTLAFYFSLALSQVNADFIKSGKFALERMGVVYEAKPHLKSPFDPSNNRVKGIYPDNYHNVYKANAQ